MDNIQFWRTKQFSDTSFLDLVKRTFGKIFTKGSDAKNWLITNGYYTSYPDIVTDGLILNLDAGNSDSFKGEPTTNYIYNENPKNNAPYQVYVIGGGLGTMIENHPNAIQTYNVDDTLLTDYINYYPNWENNQHAYWIYDNELKKPVVTMIDKDGDWIAKYMGLNMNAWSTYGYGVGTQYTISWMQWTTHLDKRINVGMYTKNASDSYNFWDGLSNGSSTSTNTKINTWERVYHTFTVSSDWDQTKLVHGIYFYGHYFINGQTVKVSDVQLEIKSHPTPFVNGTRGTTYATGGGWCDLSGNGNHGELVNGPTYNSDNLGSVSFDGTNKIITPISSFGNNMTWCAWIKCHSDSSGFNMFMGSFLPYFSFYHGSRLFFSIYIDGVQSTIQTSSNLNLNTWYYATFTTEVLGANTEMCIYTNGQYSTSNLFSGYPSDPGYAFTIGDGMDESNWYPFDGNVSIVQIYNRRLSEAEILQNFNAYKDRFGL